MKKITLLFLVLLVSCSARKSNIPIDIVSKQTAATWFNESCKQCSELKEAYKNPGDARGVKQFDYQDKTYIVINSGTKSSHGFSIEIPKIREEADQIIIEARDIPPGTSVTLPATENPALIVSMSLTKKEVIILWN